MMPFPKYPKFKSKEECAYPERDNCNRCEFMKCICMENWHCIYKKSIKDKQINKSDKEKTIT